MKIGRFEAFEAVLSVRKPPVQTNVWNAFEADDADRTRDPNLGKVVLYH